MISVRIAASADSELVQAVTALLPQLSRSARPPTPELVARVLGDPATTLFVAEDGADRRDADAGRVRDPDRRRAWIEDVVTDGAARGKGVATALVKAALARAARARRAHGGSHVASRGREDGNRLYLNLGFEQRTTNVYQLPGHGDHRQHTHGISRPGPLGSVTAEGDWEGAVSKSSLQGRNWVLAAMIFAVSMTFIDQTIVSIAVPDIQRELDLTSTGVQWVVNAYLIALAALFALGGRLSDIFGHTKMCVIGVIVFVVASTMCGLTPKGTYAEAWIVGFRAVQGAGGALMFPAALAIVVNTFPLRERGKALALFFGIAGGLTAVGPILGGYLAQWTWRAIFWVNIPVALIALVLIAVSKPKTEYRRAPIDYLGAVLIAAGIALSIFGLQQSVPWGWSNPWIWICIVGGLVIIGSSSSSSSGRRRPSLPSPSSASAPSRSRTWC